MDKRARDKILSYIRDEEAQRSPHILDESHALQYVYMTEKRNLMNEEEHKAFLAAFRKEFRHLLPKLELAQKSGKKLDHFIR